MISIKEYANLFNSAFTNEGIHTVSTGFGPNPLYKKETKMNDELCQSDQKQGTETGRVFTGADPAVSPISKVTIVKVDNGFIVRVGCKTLVSTTWKAVSEGLECYYKDPIKAEQKYCK